MSDATYQPYVTDQEREDWNKAIAHMATVRQLTADETIEALAEALKPCIDAMTTEIQRIVNILAENIRPIVDAFMETWRHLWDAICRASVPAKWWHIYTHTKKARIRKKYRDRITRAVLEALADGGDET